MKKPPARQRHLYIQMENFGVKRKPPIINFISKIFQMMASYLFFFLPMTSSLKRTTGRSWNTKFSSCTDALTSVAVLDRRTVQKDLQRSLSGIAGTNQSISNRPTLETCFMCVDVCGSMCVCVCLPWESPSVCSVATVYIVCMHESSHMFLSVQVTWRACWLCFLMHK